MLLVFVKCVLIFAIVIEGTAGDSGGEERGGGDVLRMHGVRSNECKDDRKIVSCKLRFYIMISDCMDTHQ